MWRKTLFLGAILSVVFVLPFMAGAATTSSVDLYGGYLEGVAIGPNGYGYATFMAPNGLYVSTDLSADPVVWNALGSSYDVGQCMSLGVDANYVYAVCGINLYRSADGATWDTLGLTNVGQYMHVDDNRVFMIMREEGPSGGVTMAISTDQGENFSTGIEVGSEVQGISAMSSAGDVVYAMATLESGYEVYKSIDGGLTWAGTGYTISGGAAYLTIAVKESDTDQVALQAGDTLLLSLDGGVNFTDLGFNVAGKVQFIGDTLYSGLKHTDDYTNWVEIDGGAINIGRNDVAISGNTMITSTNVGVAVSTDGGATWADTKEGINALQVDAIAQHPSDKGKVALAIYGGFARTENYTDATPIWEFNTDIGSSTAVGYYSDLVLVGAGANIYYSADDGATLTSAGVSKEGITDFIKNEGVYYASYSEGVLSSADGMTWTDFGLSGVSVNSLAGTSTGKLYAAVGSEGEETAANLGVYKYNGSTWSQVVSDGTYNDIIVVDNDQGNNVVYAVSQPGSSELGGKIILSTDYGITWTDLTANGLSNDDWYHQIVAQTSDENVLYASTARPAGTGKIYKTLDGGDTWSLFYTGLRDEIFQAMLYDDLMVGSNAGLMSINSEAKITVTRTKTRVKAGNRSRLKVTLTDKDTNDALVNKPVKLYYRYKTTGNWKLLKQKKTGAKGKTSFNRRIIKKTYFKVSWAPKKAAVKRAYGSSAYKKLTNVKIK